MVSLPQLENIRKSWKTNKNEVDKDSKKILEVILEANKEGEAVELSHIIQTTGFDRNHVCELLGELYKKTYVKFVRQQHGNYSNPSYELKHFGRQVFESEREIKTNIIKQMAFIKERHQLDYVYITNIAAKSGLGRYSITRFYIKELERQQIVHYRNDIQDNAINMLKEGAKLTSIGEALVDLFKQQNLI